VRAVLFDPGDGEFAAVKEMLARCPVFSRRSSGNAPTASRRDHWNAE
jgi:hypothetical protein